MTWDHITVMMDRPGEIRGCLSGQVDLSSAARCVIVLPPGIIAIAGRGRSSMHVPPPAQATGGYDRHPRETGGDRAPGCEDVGLERASAGSVTIVPGMERKWVGFGRLLHDEVPGHLLGVDVATEEVGAGVIGRGKGIGGRRRTGDGVTYEDLLVRR